MVKPKNRKCKVIPVDRNGLAYLLKLKTPFTIQGFPEDGTIVDIDYDIMIDQFLVLVHSDTFEEVGMCSVFPYLDLTLQKAKPQ